MQPSKVESVLCDTIEIAGIYEQGLIPVYVKWTGKTMQEQILRCLHGLKLMQKAAK